MAIHCTMVSTLGQCGKKILDTWIHWDIGKQTTPKDLLPSTSMCFRTIIYTTQIFLFTLLTHSHRGDLPWDQYLRSRKEWGGGKLASPETSGLASTCNPPPYTFDSQGGGDDYDRSTCNLCGGDFWCSRNEPFPNATFVDPLRSNMTDPIRGRTITKMTIKAWGSMNLDKWHLENDATAGHVTVNGRQHRKTIASTGRDKWLYCNDCFESGAYTINEAEKSKTLQFHILFFSICRIHLAHIFNKQL